jgi:hypothetical protein
VCRPCWIPTAGPHPSPASLVAASLRRRFCYSNLTRTRPICVSDEHYLPTLLASYGLDNQTDCAGLAHYADWSAGGWHPRTFGAADALDAALVARMRAPGKVAAGGGAAVTTGGGAGGPGGCDADAALDSARALLRQPSAEELAAQGGAAGRWRQVVLRRPPAGLLQRLGQLLQLPWLPALHTPAQRRQASGATSLPRDTGDSSGEQQATGSANPGGSQQPAGLQTSSFSQQLAAWGQQELGYRAMGPRCSLFARKFTAGALPGTVQMALSCGGLGLGGWCEYNQPLLEEQY